MSGTRERDMGRTPNICVIGSGYWGKNLVRNFNALGALHCICDKNSDTLNNFREQYPGVNTALALNEVLADEAVDAVAVATPAETHFSIARETLMAGKHCFVEKPLTLEQGEARELIALARDRGLTLMVGHLLQYHPVFVHLKKMAEAGELGRINYIYSHRLNLGKIRREENIFWSFAPHDISMLLSLAGEEPDSVSTTGGNYLHKKIADVTVTNINFPSGMKAHIFVSWLHPFKEQKFVVVGDQQMAVFDDTQPWEDKLLLYPHKIRWEAGMPIPDKAEAIRADIEQSEPLKDECAHFLHCVSTGETPRTDGPEGLRVLKILNAGQESMDRHGCRVQVRPNGYSSDAARPEKKTAFVHDTAVVDTGAQIGDGSRIWHFSHVLPGVRMGQDCNVGQNCVIGPDVSIGRGCKIQNNVSVYKGVTLEDEVFCGPSMVFTNVFNPRAHIRRMDQVRTTRVGKRATLGANCTIICGNDIGRYAFVGAGAVVTRSVPDHALMAGNPARRMGWVCECGERLNEELACPECGLEYAEEGGSLKKTQQ